LVELELSPLALSLSKGCPFFRGVGTQEGQGFDRLSPNGELE